MNERMQIEEAREVLADFFEIHGQSQEARAREKASEILSSVEAEDMVVLGSMPTLRIGRSILSFVSESDEPEAIYLIRKDRGGRTVSRKVSLKP